MGKMKIWPNSNYNLAMDDWVVLMVILIYYSCRFDWINNGYMIQEFNSKF